MKQRKLLKLSKLNNLKKVVKLTKPLESSTRKKIDNWLKDLGWNIDEESKGSNVITERAKTEAQQKKFNRKKPDYVLYKSGTEDPLAVIEAKKKGQSVEKAIKQAIDLYAKPNILKE